MPTPNNTAAPPCGAYPSATGR